MNSDRNIDDLCTSKARNEHRLSDRNIKDMCTTKARNEHRQKHRRSVHITGEE